MLDESELEGRGKMHIRLHKSTRTRKMHEVSQGQLDRVTNATCGLLPRCYWCEAVEEQLACVRAKAAALAVAAGIDQAAGRMPPERLTFERARLASEHLDMSSKLRQAYWREAEGHWNRAQEREGSSTMAAAMMREADAVQAWRRAQASAWRALPPKSAELAALQQLQWLLEAARGDHCRHCVDPLPPACPKCGACELDADPGEWRHCTCMHVPYMGR